MTDQTWIVEKQKGGDVGNGIVYHYMDDIVFAQRTSFTVQQEQQLRQQLASGNLVIADEKNSTTTCLEISGVDHYVYPSLSTETYIILTD